MLLVGLVAVLGLAGDAVAGSPADATIIALDGDVTVSLAAQGERSATLGLELSVDDFVTTDFDATAILRLHNNYLVRVDEDLTLQVADILLIKAPRIEPDDEAQLAKLLSPSDYESLRWEGEAERIAGHHARLAAATSVGVGMDGSSTRGGGGAVADSEALDDLAPESLMDEGKAERRRTATKERSRAKSLEAMATPSASPPPNAPLAQARVYTEESLQEQLVSASPLRECLVTSAAALPVPVDKLELRFILRDQVVQSVALQSGLPLPYCARELLDGARVQTDKRELKLSISVGKE